MRKYKSMHKYVKYINMKKEGKSPHEIYISAKADGLESVQRIEILWYVCDLSPQEAKELMICVDTPAKTLSEYQEKYILPALKKAFEQEERDTSE